MPPTSVGRSEARARDSSSGHCRLVLTRKVARQLDRQGGPWLVVHEPDVPAHVLLMPAGVVERGSV